MYFVNYKKTKYTFAILYSLLNLIEGYNVLTLNNVTELGGLNQIIKRQTRQDNFNRNGIQVNIAESNSLHDSKDPDGQYEGKNKVLIKRKLPHSNSLPKVIYDSDSSPFYKPLIRFHKFKPIHKSMIAKTNEKGGEEIRKISKLIQDVGGLLKTIKGNTSGWETTLINILDRILTKRNYYVENNKKRPNVHGLILQIKNIMREINKQTLASERKLLNILNEIIPKSASINRHRNGIGKFRDEEVREPFEDSIVSSLVNDIKNILNNIDTKNLESKGTVLKILRNILNNKDALRGYNNVKSEEQDPDESSKKQKEAMLEAKWKQKHSHSLWNFWTYHQSLYQDECPDRMVKVGNICIWTPPH